MLPNVHAQGQNCFLYCSLKIANYVSGDGVAAENLQILFMASDQLSIIHLLDYRPCVFALNKSHSQMNRVQFSKYFYGSISLISLFKMAAMTSCSVLFLFSGMVLE